MAKRHDGQHPTIIVTDNMKTQLINGDCLQEMAKIPDNSVDAIVTDPPYGLSFMGKKWDYDVPTVEVWAECLRVLKPGGHLLAFAGTRTQHRMAVRIEDAGFEIRDMIAWVYGSGFPKSLDVSKAIDKAAGAEREILGVDPVRFARLKNQINGSVSTGDNWEHSKRDVNITAPATEAARQWQGWGTALKPALEPITVARKPLIGTVAENVLAHGTGAINVDGCRVEANGEKTGSNGAVGLTPEKGWNPNNLPRSVNREQSTTSGRWPANLIHDGSDEVVAGFPVTDKAAIPRNGGFRNNNAQRGTVDFKSGCKPTLPVVRGDSGSAARFFYCAKASKKDRDGSTHPTMKPTDLMRYLCRLVTPPNGVILDPFMGSGSTGKAAKLEGFQFIGIELDKAYFDIASKRIAETIGNTEPFCLK